jgi:hypothetical protein
MSQDDERPEGPGSTATRNRLRIALGQLESLAVVRMQDRTWGELQVTLIYEKGEIKRAMVTDKTTF